MSTTIFVACVVLASCLYSFASATNQTSPFVNPINDNSNTPKVKTGKLPQLVVLTFDDAVNNELWEALYKDFFNDLTDPYTRCDVKATFFVSHNNTDYSKVNHLFNNGHEIALHSFSHGGDGHDSEFLVRNFRMGRWQLEVQQNIKAMIEHAFLPKDTFFGWRAPFLYTGGDESFSALNKTNVLYDASLSFYEKNWPYPMFDAERSRSCLIKPCPTHSDYLLIEAPLSVWTGIDGEVCAMMDACRFGSTREEAFDVMMANFRRFQEENAPLPLSLHGGALNNRANSHFALAFRDFLRTLLDMKDVHFVTMKQLVAFTRSPMNTFQYMRTARRACATFRPEQPCQPKRPACEYRNYKGGNSVYLNTCAKRCPLNRSEIVFNYFGRSCCEAV